MRNLRFAYLNRTMCSCPIVHIATITGHGYMLIFSGSLGGLEQIIIAEGGGERVWNRLIEVWEPESQISVYGSTSILNYRQYLGPPTFWEETGDNPQLVEENGVLLFKREK